MAGASESHGQIGMETGLTQFDPGVPALEDERVEVARSSKRNMTAFGAVRMERRLNLGSRSGPPIVPWRTQGVPIHGLIGPWFCVAATVAYGYTLPSLLLAHDPIAGRGER